MKRIALLLILLCPLLLACEGERLYDTEYPVGFSFDTKLHPTSLMTAMVENVNYFLIVNDARNGRVHTLTIETNSGQKETLRIESEAENRRIAAMGANNSLVLGCVFGYDLNQSTSDLYSYVAYDRQCPACLSDFSGTNFPLKWGEKTHTLTCEKCKRTYQLLGAGASNDGHRLKTYHMRYDKTEKIFTVSNL